MVAFNITSKELRNTVAELEQVAGILLEPMPFGPEPDPTPEQKEEAERHLKLAAKLSELADRMEEERMEVIGCVLAPVSGVF